MVDLWHIAALLLGMGLGYFLYGVFLSRNRALWEFIQSAKKGADVIFLETQNTVFMKPVNKYYKDVALMKDGSAVIVPKNTRKIWNNFPNIGIVHGDFYKAVGTPDEFRKLIYDLKVLQGWNNDDIATFFEEIEHIKSEYLKEKYKYMKENKKVPIGKDANGNVIESPASEVEQKKYDIYMALPSVITEYIYTGINRTSVHAMLDVLTRQREHEKKLEQKQWIQIGFAVLLILIGLGMVLMFGGDTLSTLFGAKAITAAPNAAPAVINP